MTNSTFSHAAKELDEKLDVQLMEGCPSNDISGTMYKILRLINISILILEAFILCGSFLFHYPELTLPGYFLLGITFLAAVSSFPGWHRLFFNLCFGRLYADALSTNLLLLSVTVRKQRRDICLNMTAAVLIYSSYIVQNFI